MNEDASCGNATIFNTVVVHLKSGHSSTVENGEIGLKTLNNLLKVIRRQHGDFMLTQVEDDELCFWMIFGFNLVCYFGAIEDLLEANEHVDWVEPLAD